MARYLGETVHSDGGTKAIAEYLHRNALGESWWREVALLTVGYLNDNDLDKAAQLVRQLAVCDDGGAAEAPYYAAELATVSCLEWLADNRALRQELTDRLVALFKDKARMAQARPLARAAAGDALACLGEPRHGVSVRQDNGLPDIAWIKVPEFNEQRQHTILYNDGIWGKHHSGLSDFWIAKYPITHVQFQTFLDAPDGYRNKAWREGLAKGFFGENGLR